MNDPAGKIRVGVIGVGALGRYHARLYAQNPRAEMVGIFDVCRANAEKVGAEFGLKVYSDWHELAERCDALSVAVPATCHGSATVPLLEMGKHVLVEKPVAASVSDAEAMTAAAARAGVVLAVGHVERFNPAMDLLTRHPGKIRFIEAHRLAKFPPSRPGLPPRGTEVSVILDLMIHDIDLVLSLIDSEVARLEVSGAPVLSPSEDIASARIVFKNGSAANLTASRISQEPVRRFRVFQDDGCFSLDLANRKAALLKRGGDGLVREEAVFAEKNALAEELDDFLTAVSRSRAEGRVVNARISGEAGLRALKVAAAIEAAARRSGC